MSQLKRKKGRPKLEVETATERVSYRLKPSELPLWKQFTDRIKELRNETK